MRRKRASGFDAARVRRQERRKGRRQGRRKGRRRLLGFLLLLIVGGLAAGFVIFAHHVDGLGASPDPRYDPSPRSLAADGIVVWTGPGGGRLERAGALMEAGLGERLLVSGVNTSLTPETVAELAGLSDATALCCLDVDYAALDTRGNARETAAWAEALDYEHILLVTSAYHMPRARAELRHERGGLRVTPVAVQASDAPDWWRDTDRFKRLAAEYGKYLLSLSRGRTDGEATREPVLPTPDMDAQP